MQPVVDPLEAAQNLIDAEWYSDVPEGAAASRPLPGIERLRLRSRREVENPRPIVLNRGRNAAEGKKKIFTWWYIRAHGVNGARPLANTTLMVSDVTAAVRVTLHDGGSLIFLQTERAYTYFSFVRCWNGSEFRWMEIKPVRNLALGMPFAMLYLVTGIGGRQLAETDIFVRKTMDDRSNFNFGRYTDEVKYAGTMTVHYPDKTPLLAMFNQIAQGERVSNRDVQFGQFLKHYKMWGADGWGANELPFGAVPGPRPVGGPPQFPVIEQIAASVNELNAKVGYLDQNLRDAVRRRGPAAAVVQEQQPAEAAAAVQEQQPAEAAAVVQGQQRAARGAPKRRRGERDANPLPGARVRTVAVGPYTLQKTDMTQDRRGGNRRGDNDA